MESDEESVVPPCPACHGEMVRAQLKSPGLGECVLSLEESDDLLSEEPELLSVGAWVCTVCGHVELHCSTNELDCS